MIIGIEGTGSQAWDNKEFRRSFVRKVLHQCTEKEKYYFIGPNDQGSDGRQIFEAAWLQLVEYKKSERLILVGYSRGAAYCMKMAEALASYRRLDYLIMFDAVARNDYTASRMMNAAAWAADMKPVKIPVKVPTTVDFCVHAVRNPQAGSRGGFGNVGLEAEDARKTTMMLRGDFMCSHGAMGGTSYDAVNEEGLTDRFGDVGRPYADGNWMLNHGMPGDVRYKNAPRYPVTNKHQDDQGMHQVGKWMWHKLQAFEILPAKADFAPNAPPFTYKGTPGVAYPVR